MKRILFIIGLLATVLMSGCSKSNNGPEGLHSVTWYENHAPQMMKQLKWCGNEADRSKLESCQNATKAMTDNVVHDAMGGGRLRSPKKDITPTQGLNGKPW